MAPGTCVAVAERSPHSPWTKPEQPAGSVPRQVGNESWVAVDPPPLLLATGAKDELRLLEGAVPVAEGGPHPRDAKPNEIPRPVAGEVCDEARVAVDAPPLLEPEIGDHESWPLERAVAVAERSPHTALAEPDDVDAAA